MELEKYMLSEVILSPKDNTLCSSTHEVSSNILVFVLNLEQKWKLLN